MDYIVIFEDNDAHAEMRTKYMAEHLAFLEKNKASIHAAGPLTDTDTSSPAGGIWIVSANHRDEVRQMIEQDPFFPTGLRKSARILQWKKVFPK